VGKIVPEKPFSILVRQEMMALAMASPFATSAPHFGQIANHANILLLSFYGLVLFDTQPTVSKQ